MLKWTESCRSFGFACGQPNRNLWWRRQVAKSLCLLCHHWLIVAWFSIWKQIVVIIKICHASTDTLNISLRSVENEVVWWVIINFRPHWPPDVFINPPAIVLCDENVWIAPGVKIEGIPLMGVLTDDATDEGVAGAGIVERNARFWAWWDYGHQDGLLVGSCPWCERLNCRRCWDRRLSWWRLIFASDEARLRPNFLESWRSGSWRTWSWSVPGWKQFGEAAPPLQLFGK